MDESSEMSGVGALTPLNHSGEIVFLFIFYYVLLSIT